jgi:hypothetical protein
MLALLSRVGIATGWGYTEVTKNLTPPRVSDVLREAEQFILPQVRHPVQIGVVRDTQDSIFSNRSVNSVSQGMMRNQARIISHRFINRAS